VQGIVEEHCSEGDISLFVEFSALISWQPGSWIDKHKDNGKPYLAQRHFAAIVYLNDVDKNFDGGVFEFGDGQQVHPKAGRLLTYSAADIHSVTPVTSGERFTVALWFTKDGNRDEDRAILRQLTVDFSLRTKTMPIPTSMYLYSDGMDIRICRLACLDIGLAIQTSKERWQPLVALDDSDLDHNSERELRLLFHTNDEEKESQVSWSTVFSSSPFVVVCGLMRYFGEHGNASSAGPSTTEPWCEHHHGKQVSLPSATSGQCKNCLWLRGASIYSSGGQHPMDADTSLQQAVHEERARMDTQWNHVKKAQALWLQHGALFSVL